MLPRAKSKGEVALRMRLQERSKGSLAAGESVIKWPRLKLKPHTGTMKVR